MYFSTLILTSLLGALSVAAPSKRSSETVTVETLYVRDNNGIQATSFTLQPANVSCSGSGDALADYQVASCVDPTYSFAINGTLNNYNLRLYKALGVGFGLYGETEHIPVYCHAGGNGPQDYVCSQVGDIEVVLESA